MPQRACGGERKPFWTWSSSSCQLNSDSHFPLKCFYIVSHFTLLRFLVLKPKCELVCEVMDMSSCNTWGTVKRGLRVDGGEPEKAQQAVTKKIKQRKNKNQTPTCSTFFIEIYLFYIKYFKDSVLKILHIQYLLAPFQ